MGYFILTGRSLIWMLLTLISTLMMLSALLSPVWIKYREQHVKFENKTIIYTPSLGIYAKCGKPITKNSPKCTFMSAKGILELAEFYPLQWKFATVFLGIGLFIMNITIFTSLLSCCVQSLFKKSIFTLSGSAQCIAGLFFIFGVMLNPMAWGTERVQKLCGEDSSAFYLAECTIGNGLIIATIGTCLTFLAACSTLAAEKSTSSDKIQDKIYEGKSLICVN